LSLVFCTPAPELVGPEGWLPTEPFDNVFCGCNHLVCGHCKENVTTTLHPSFRLYRCACQTREQSGTFYHLGSDYGHMTEFRTMWNCAGHPQVTLPFVFEGVEINETNLEAVVTKTIAAPPFQPPKPRSISFWVERLYALLPNDSYKRVVGLAVGKLLSSHDTRLACAAIDFFYWRALAFGAEQVAIVVGRDRARLAMISNPFREPESMLASMLQVLSLLIGWQTKNGRLNDSFALEVSKDSLLQGQQASTPYDLISSVAAADEDWFVMHAAQIARKQPTWTADLRYALMKYPEAVRASALSDLDSINAKL
jgi:hypothetical protein